MRISFASDVRIHPGNPCLWKKPVQLTLHLFCAQTKIAKVAGFTLRANLRRLDTKVAIMISSGDDLKLGPDAMLTANGNYDSSMVDDRAAFDLEDSGERSGEPIDVAVYLKSLGYMSDGDVQLESGVWVDAGGTLLIDAASEVISGADGEGQFAGVSADHLEVVSRITDTLQEAIDNSTLPSADDIETVERNIGGTYILRGGGNIPYRGVPITGGRGPRETSPRVYPTGAIVLNPPVESLEAAAIPARSECLSGNL